MTAQQFAVAMAFLNLLNAVTIFVRGVFYVANMMSHKTYWPFRLSWVLITTASLGVILGPMVGLYVNSIPATLMFTGVAIFVSFDRRTS